MGDELTLEELSARTGEPVEGLRRYVATPERYST
jgi:hypothetical protein